MGDLTGPKIGFAVKGHVNFVVALLFIHEVRSEADTGRKFFLTLFVCQMYTCINVCCPFIALLSRLTISFRLGTNSKQVF